MSGTPCQICADVELVFTRQNPDGIPKLQIEVRKAFSGRVGLLDFSTFIRRAVPGGQCLAARFRAPLGFVVESEVQALGFEVEKEVGSDDGSRRHYDLCPPSA